jgi:hypothetical protein|tara:strand:+ start:387 stop:746 length:360 start_codon:yes stop_codon:yes gene_type:complete
MVSYSQLKGVLMATKTVNYTTAQVDQIISMYKQSGNESLPEIAAAVGKSVRSVRSKLVREGVYSATPKPKRSSIDKGPTKKELLNELEQVCGFDVTPLSGATKEGLLSLISFAKKMGEA